MRMFVSSRVKSQEAGHLLQMVQLSFHSLMASHVLTPDRTQVIQHFSASSGMRHNKLYKW